MILNESEIALEKARRVLEQFKKEERKKKRYTWTGKNLAVSHTDKKRLKAMVEELGYEWQEGTVKKE